VTGFFISEAFGYVLASYEILSILLSNYSATLPHHSL